MSSWDNRQGLRGPHFHSRVPKVSLEIVRGSAHNRLRPIKPPVFLIGSAGDCDLVLGDKHFPEVHTYLYVTSAGISVRHIGEGPELTINGIAVETGRVNDGDRLQMGPYEFVLHVSPSPAGHDDSDRPRVTVASESYSEWDASWEHAQLLLCDLPAPVRPSAVPLRQTPLQRAVAMFPELRKAIA
ncbi:MAG TPA: FHA domain-containing protein [Pirellulaceae bacterium]|nr:FHA domain-containing protein [Pirellulaceae bacterium]